MNKPTVFFSHSSLDKEIAKYLKDKLIEYTGGTVRIFVSSDGESIPFGKNWLSTIEHGLEESRIMFLLVTPNSINNLWLSFEAGFGYSKNIRVIPLCFKVSVSDLKYPLGMLQGYDLQSADSFNNIISILNSEFDYSHKLSFTESDFSEISSIGITDDVNQEFAKIVKEVTWYKNFQPNIIESLEGEELTLYNKICSGLLYPTEEFL
ncbi:TPA: toll/interleukin-1 receptor domain-containing protein, partial [Streptococcus equi subsp. zooepidemicus]|nr:toll/interleukin-1 receptor domain-containing protein [Streptococcus equi subsp. zooepidemicus]